MPDYRYIYEREAEEYQRLVSAEDAGGELPRALARVVVLRGARVIEIGMGTGRVTRILLEAGASVTGYERSPAMIAVARRLLGSRFVAVVADGVLRQMWGALDEEGTLIVIETLGTGVDVPRAPNATLEAYHDFLERSWGMQREVFPTDYLFDSVEAACASIGFFFGPELAARVRERGTGVVPEWTGLWWKNKSGARP
jgi:SAM-dependent methyltransferase